MEIYKSQQLWVLFACTLAGIGCAITLDILRAIRGNFKLGSFITSLLDILFWIVCSIIVYMTIYISNSADIRWHEFIGLGAGFLIYTFIMHRYFYKIICKITILIAKVFKVILKILRIPVNFLHILIVPLKNVMYKIKSRIFFITHKFYTGFISKTKKTYQKIRKN